MKIKTGIINLTVFLISIAVALLAAEFIARMVFNPADILKLEVVGDDILGAVPSASSMAGFDKWGFRNREVPLTADIVAVGDSHTYGNTARMVEAWPYVLGQSTSKKVYNMGLGGYGPNQYFYLTKTKALTLKPKMIIWGLYMGDDFENAFSITYGLDYWASLRKLPPQQVDANIWELTPPTRNKKIRIWLSRHSVIYQLAFHAGFGGKVQGEYQIKNAATLYPGTATSLVVPDKQILEAFRPKGVLFGLNQDDPKVREGMRITFELLKQTNELCRQNNVKFLVAVIPTKETVFSEYLEHNSKLPLSETVDKLISSERTARTEMFSFMDQNGIAYVDVLPALKKSVSEKLYARTAADMHPGRNGYRVIGEAISANLKQSEPDKMPAARLQ